jgi:hypothetical protein
VGGDPGLDRRHIYTIHGRHQVAREITLVEQQHHDARHHEREHRREQLLTPTIHLKGRVGTVAAQDVTGLEVVAHVGESRAGRSREADEERQANRWEADQDTDDQCNKRHCESGEPS